VISTYERHLGVIQARMQDHPQTVGEAVRIVCLHTADSNIALFDAAARAAGFEALELAHVVRADLLALAAAVHTATLAA
jgi:hypothetical protein